jgi:hypothetical protein
MDDTPGTNRTEDLKEVGLLNILVKIAHVKGCIVLYSTFKGNGGWGGQKCRRHGLLD